MCINIQCLGRSEFKTVISCELLMLPNWNFHKKVLLIIVVEKLHCYPSLVDASRKSVGSVKCA